MDGSFHIRIDNRLLHGQVVQFWLPYLEISKLVIADDCAANHMTMSAVFRMAVPESIEMSIVSVHDLASKLKGSDVEHTFVIVSDVFDIGRALMCGTPISRISLGNVHTSPDRTRVTDAVYLSHEEVQALTKFVQRGIEVEVQTFPGEVLKLELDGNGGAQWSR